MFGTLFLLLIILLIILGVVFSFTPKPNENKKESIETTNWEYQQEQSKRESEAEKNKEWFSDRRWSTDKEIDWACQRIKTDTMPGSFPGQELGRFKILPAHQFHYVKESKGTAEAQAHLAFPELLTELTGFSGEMNNLYDYSIVGDQLVFIPVNNPDFHWSLLVYQAKSQKFWHYDTLKGANYEYVKPLVGELLQQIHQTNEPDLAEYLIPKHDIRQGNGSDCGIAVIAIIKRIITLTIKQSWIDKLKYGTFHLGDDLGEFDFPKEREKLRTEYLKENGTN